jgi:hypothetical protein
MIPGMNEQSLDRVNAFLAACSARVQPGEVLDITPAEIGRDLGFPDALSTARAVRALIARKRLEQSMGAYRLVSSEPVRADEKEAIGRRPRKRRTGAKRAGRLSRSESDGRANYSDLGRAAVDRLLDLGREVASLRAALKTAREEAHESRDARVEAEHRAESLTAKVRDLEQRADMAESNLRTLLATAKGVQRDSAVGDSEMEAILGVLKGGDYGGGRQEDGGGHEGEGSIVDVERDVVQSVPSITVPPNA